MAINISGTVYTDEGSTTMGSGRHVNVSVNGAASAGSTTTASDGTYTISGITAASGAVLTLYLQGDSENAVTVTHSTGSNMSGIDLYQDRLNCRSDDGAALTGANLNTSDANGATGISAIYSASSTTTTLASGKSLLIMSGQTLAPATTYAFSIPGDFINNGTYTAATNTITMTGTGSGGRIKTNGSSLNNLTINGSGGTYTLQDALTIGTNGTLTLTAGTLDVSTNNYTVTLNGLLTVTSGGFTARSGLVKFSKSGNYNPNNISFYNLQVTAAATLTGAVTVTHNLTTDSGIPLILNGNNLTMTGATLTNQGSLRLLNSETLTGFTNDTTQGTISYRGSGTFSSLNAGTSYFNLEFAGSFGTLNMGSSYTIAGALTVSTGTVNANGQTVSVTGALSVSNGTYTSGSNSNSFGSLSVTSVLGTFTGSTGAVTVTGGVTIGNASGGTLTAPSSLTVGGNWTKAAAGTFTHNNGTVTLNGSAQTISGSSTFYNLVATNNGDILTFTDGTTQTVSNSVSFQNVTLQGTSTGGWTIDMPATQTNNHITVSYSTATSNTGEAGTGSTNGGNNTNWNFPSGKASYYIDLHITGTITQIG